MRVVAIAGVVFALVVSAAAVTVPRDAVHAREATPCEPEYVAHLGPACRLANGHFRVFLSDGTSLLTHGPDPILDEEEPGFDSGSDQRQPPCAEEWRMHVLYGYPSGSNRFGSVVNDLKDAVRRMNALLNADALASGNVEADFRVACDDSGDIRVDAFAGNSGDFDAVANAARAAGFTSPHTDYLIFWDGNVDALCGVANLATDDSLSAGNSNLAGPDYAVTYESCWDSRTPMHENGHNQGAVQTFATMSDLTGHCLEGIDVMCYPTSEILVLCGDRVHYDCNFDTYFDAQPESGEWLASHWNIGSRLNKYIHFGDQPSGGSQPTPSPSPTPSSTSSPPTTSSPTTSPTKSPTPKPTKSTKSPTATKTSATWARSTAADESTKVLEAQDDDGAPVPGVGWMAFAGVLAGAMVLRRRGRGR